MDSNNGAPVMCEVCGTYFETRRGLSSHARLHLRQLGVSMSESSGAPIELLYKILEEKDAESAASASAAGTHLPQRAAQKESKGSSFSSKAWSRFTAASPPGFSTSLPSLSSSSTSVASYEPGAKPMWAPQLTDAPLTLASNSKDEAHVCQLCGAWYETRKGLSSHARSHLRQLGITESGDGKSPIELLNEIIKAEDLKPGSMSGPALEEEGYDEEDAFSNLHSPAKSSSATKRPLPATTPNATLKGSPSSSSALLPPAKRAKPAESEHTCVLCGEEFENRKGLGSHSRSHLRQMGVSHLLEKGSAIDAVQELVSSGVLAGVRPLPPPLLETDSPSSHSRSMSPLALLSSSPIKTTTTSSAQSPPSSSSSSPGPLNRAPKAKKGFRLAVDPLTKKPKREDLDMFIPVTPERYSSSSSPAHKLSSPAAAAERSHSAVPLVQCDFCQQLFDSRKALSCHARAHLRQLGIAWSVSESPIDILKDVMAHEVKKEAASGGRSSVSGVPPKSSSLDNRHNNSPLDFSVKEKPSPPKSGSATQAVPVQTSCELCGFEFDNRKALASHCRAHLRQLGMVVEWKAEEMKGASPIAMLHNFLRKDSAKVAEITRRYQTGDLYIKKTHKNALSPGPPASDSDSLKHNQSVHRVYLFNGESSKATQSQERLPQAARSHTQARTAGADLNARSSTGSWPPKSSTATEEAEAARSGNIPALLPPPPRTPLVKLVGKVYSLKCRFCEEVFQGSLSVQGDWIRHLQKHILSLGYRGKASTLPAPVAAPALVGPVAV